jgi:SprT protein
MVVTAAVKARVQAKLAEGIAIAQRKYGVTIDSPTVVYKKRGTAAGTANYRTWTIDLNPVLLMENVDSFIARTVPHELAHLITDKVYPEAHSTEIVRTHRGLRRTKRDVHGQYWQSVMRALGADPSRCHSYDTTNSKIHKTTTKHEYRCSGCGVVVAVGGRRHSALQSNPRAVYHQACGRSSQLVPVRSVTVAPVQQARPAAAAKTPATPTAGSKLDRCRALYQQYKGLYTTDLRQQCIAAFVRDIGMTAAGASTYYSTCRNLDKG